MRHLWCTTAGELADFLEKEIAAGRNPKTPEDWSALMVRMHEAKKSDYVSELPDDMSGSRLAGFIRDEGVDIKCMNTQKKDPSEEEKDG